MSYNPTVSTSSMTPTEYLDWLTQIGNSPQGQAAQAAMQQTIAMNVKQALAAMANERDRIAIAKGQAEADRWYKQESLKLAQQAHQLAVKAQEQNYELAAGGLTGQFQGAPTLAAIGQQGQMTGMYQGSPTLANLAQTAQYTGLYNGTPTLQAQNQQQQYGLQLGAQTGYQGGQATLSREQAAANAALQAAQIGSSLRGPGDWAQYLQAMNGIAGSPASALVASAPGGLGQAAGSGGGPMTLAQMLGQAGVMPGQGPSQQPGGQSFLHGDPGVGSDVRVYPGGTPGFNEQTGSYSSAPAGGMRSTMPVGGGSQPTGRSIDSLDGGGSAVTMDNATTQQQDWNPYSLTGAVGQVASAPRVTNAQLGLTDDEATTLKGYFNNPHTAPVGYWESKSPTQRSYLDGLNSYFGGDPETFKTRYANSRTRQGSAFAAT